MSTILELLPLLNFVFVMVLIPIWKLAKSLSVSKDEVDELKKLNKSITQEIKILKLVLFQYLPNEAIKTYMNEQMKLKEEK